MPNSIEVTNLSKSYKEKLAVNNISFKVKEGQIIGLLGPNGCGKTTTIAMLLGLLKPSNGKILIEGKNEHHDFYLPFLFKTIIMSNSTFGWWSIFLNTDESCKVYMPNIFEKKPIGGGFCGLPVMHNTSEIRHSQPFKIIL